MTWKQFFWEDSISLPSRVKIFDTTLRDGEQTPGVALTPKMKLEIARALDELGVDVIEAGYPIISSGEEKAVKAIASEGLNAKICALSRINRMDMDAAIRCDVDWIHIFVATSDIHLKHKLKMSKEEALRKSVEAVEYAKAHGLTVQFSAEDATRTDPNFLSKFYGAIVDAGSDSIDIPDTVGVMTPERFFNLVSKIKKTVKAPVAVHCHNDFGLATANTIAGVLAGAEIVHVTVNGIGERAGNASLEEVAAILKLLYHIPMNLDLKKIFKVSRLVEKYTGIQVQKNKAIVGDNAFTHESGIHVHGILCKPETYEPIPPELFGRERRVVIGKHSGSHAIAEILRKHGLTLASNEVSEILREVKERGDRGEVISEDLIVELALKRRRRKIVELKEILLTSSIDGCACLVSVRFNGREVTAISYSRSPIDAGVKALGKSLKQLIDAKIEDVRIVNRNFISEAEVTLSLGESRTREYAADEDPVKAVAIAALSAAEKLLRRVEICRG